MANEPTAESSWSAGESCDLRAVVVRPILPQEERSWDELMATHHYLGFRQLTGASLN
jgi:hypothetical protein